MDDRTLSNDVVGSSMTTDAGTENAMTIKGHFDWTLLDNQGQVIADGGFDNLVTTVGKNSLCDQTLRASSYTAANYMGLISSASFSAVAAGDTQASHAGWLEAGNANAPTYSGTRATATYGASSAGTIVSTGNTFVFTGSGTVQGGFVNVNGGSATIDNTSGVLLSAGTLASAQPVISGNTLTMSHTLTLS